MAKATKKKKPAAPPPSTVELDARATRDRLRRLKNLHRSIKAEARAVGRAQDTANATLGRLLSVYVERLDKVLVDRLAWDQIREENAAMSERLRIIDAPIAASVRELAGAAK